MDKIPTLALVLFDIDGCTAIVATNKITSSGKPVTPGLQCSLTNNRTEYKIEVLQLSDSKPTLNTFEKEWAKLERARALDKEKNKRGHREHGFLTVQPDVDDIVVPEPIATQVQSVREMKRKRTGKSVLHSIANRLKSVVKKKTVKAPRKQTANQRKEGSGDQPLEHTSLLDPNQTSFPLERTGTNNRKITVLFEGAGDYSEGTVLPQRPPVYLDELDDTQRDIVTTRLEEHSRHMRSVQVQTDPVLVFRDEDDIGEQFRKPTCVCKDQRRILEEINDKKLEQILQLLKQQSNLESSVVSSVSEETEMEIEEEEEEGVIVIDQSRIVISDSELNHEEQSVQTIQENNEEQLELLESYNTCSEQVNQDSNDRPSYVQMLSGKGDDESECTLSQMTEECYKENLYTINYGDIQEDTNVTHSFQEIACAMDMNSVGANAEVRISRKLVNDQKLMSSSGPNLAWNLTRSVFRRNELEGRNCLGRRGKVSLSPRRLKAVIRAVSDSYGDSNVNKSLIIDSINQGIRNMFRPKLDVNNLFKDLNNTISGC